MASYTFSFKGPKKKKIQLFNLNFLNITFTMNYPELQNFGGENRLKTQTLKMFVCHVRNRGGKRHTVIIHFKRTQML